MEAVSEYRNLIQQIESIEEPVQWFEKLEKIGTQAAAIITELGRAGLDEMIEASQEILSCINTKNPQINAITAITIGAMVENGMPPQKIEEPIMNEFINILKQAREFVNLVDERVPEDLEQEEAEGGYWVDDKFVSQELAKELWIEDSAHVQAYQAMDQFICCAVTLLSTDLKLAEKYRTDEFSRLIYFHDLNFIRMLLNVLTDEEVIVLHPATSQGYIIRISGISDNFQLHTLLADALAYDGEGPEWGIPAVRPSKSVVAVVNGTGPQESDEPSTGIWNFYNWQALLYDKISDSEIDDWIWNEGIPADIEKWEGKRVIILGPPSYARTWNTGKSIPHLKPEIKIEKVLNRDEAGDLIAKMKNS